MAWLDDVREPIAIDTETTGLEWWTPRFTRLVQFGTRDNGWAIPVLGWTAIIQAALELIVARRLPVIMHNAKFDMHALDNMDCVLPEWANVHDTKIMDHLMVPHYAHGLKVMAVRRWGPEAQAGQWMLDKFMSKHKYTWATVPTNAQEYWAYGVVDTILTRRLYDELVEKVEAEYPVQYKREMALQAIMWRAEKRGLRVDPIYSANLRQEWELEATNLCLHLQRHGIKNPSSNQQVTAVLKTLGWEPEEFTSTGQAVLNKAVKVALTAEYPEIALALIRYGRITKWSQVYLRRFVEMRDANDHVHADINTMQARTGRMSITGIPLQTLPSGEASIRSCILPDDGYMLWAVDYNSQEARLFVNYCKDPALLKALNEGKDLYTYMAQVVYDDFTITKDDPRRKMFKIMTLAWFYGAGVLKLSLITGLSAKEVATIIERLFQKFPKVRELTGDFAIGGNYRGRPAEAAAERETYEGLAYVLTSGGRRFSVPNKEELYKCVNGIMQGSGKDVLADAVLRLDMAGLADNIVVPVHDELVFQFPEGAQGAEMAQEAAKLMEDRSFPVPLTTELSGPLVSWGSKYET
jgi:DNA polymerase-1